MVLKNLSPNGELYIWMNGKLLYKKYPDGSSCLFELYGIPTRNTDRDRGHY